MPSGYRQEFYSSNVHGICPNFDRIKDTFYQVVENYDVVVYHWELDTGDNLATEETEKGLSPREVEIFKKYNQKSTVPTYVFGCRYIRVGNSYDSVEEEKQEFVTVIEKLLE